MKNIHLIPTNEPSRLYTNNGQLHLDSIIQQSNGHTISQNIYITNIEDLKENDYAITVDGRLFQVTYLLSKDIEGASKVVLTTDPKLITDGVQKIYDDFLEWYIKNTTCEYITVFDGLFGENEEDRVWKKYIVTPKISMSELLCETIETTESKTKQESIEEAAEKHWKMQYIMSLDESTKPYIIQDFIAGVKSEAAKNYWYEQFKNKK